MMVQKHFLKYTAKVQKKSDIRKFFDKKINKNSLFLSAF